MQKISLEIDSNSLSNYLKSQNFKATYNGVEVKVHLNHLKFKKGSPDIDSFLNFLKCDVMTKFVISCREAKKHYQRKDKVKADEDLLAKSIRKFSRHTAKGKLGELLLYMFIETILGAPKILSKIANLDDKNIHVKGADGIHAQFANNDLILYLGESKLYKVYSSACIDAANSLKTTLSSYQEEFDLLETSIDFKDITEEQEEQIINLLDPYEADDYETRIRFPCFIGFNDIDLKKISTEAEYENRYTLAAESRIKTFYNHINKSLSVEKVHLIILPFKSIDDFTEAFLDKFEITD